MLRSARGELEPRTRQAKPSKTVPRRPATTYAAATKDAMVLRSNRYEQWVIDLAGMRRRDRRGAALVKRALITGITGQDGSYLAEFLLDRGYEVHGVVRRSSTLNRSRIDLIQRVRPSDVDGCRFVLHYGDMTDSGGLNRLVKLVRPDEVYNLAAQSHVHVSFDLPEFTGNTDGLGTTRLLEAIRTIGVPARFYQASTSEMFGSTPPPQNETSQFHARSPYGAAKIYAHCMTVNYREAHGMFACSCILFNHESPRRGENFISRKVTRGVAAILAGT